MPRLKSPDDLRPPHLTQWLKTAPPKKKKVVEKPKTTEGESELGEGVETELPSREGGFDLKAFEAAELKKKQEEAEKKAKAQEQLDAKNNARDAELAASGKRAAGGMHKFDPDEVDVHGGNGTADDFMDAFGFGDETPADVSDSGDVSYAEHLKLHIDVALDSVLVSQPADPFKAIQQVLFQASLTGETPSPPAPRDATPEIAAYMDEYQLHIIIESCMFKMKKRLVVGPKDGVKFLISDAGDFFTEESKKLKAAGGVMPKAGMTAEECVSSLSIIASASAAAHIHSNQVDGLSLDCAGLRPRTRRTKWPSVRKRPRRKRSAMRQMHSTPRGQRRSRRRESARRADFISLMRPRSMCMAEMRRLTTSWTLLGSVIWAVRRKAWRKTRRTGQI